MKSNCLFWTVAALVVAIFVLLNQAPNGGFSRGHNGWVSSHALAIASHAKPANGMLGYAALSTDAEGALKYHYFDRYPVWTTAALSLAIQLGDSFSERILAARTVMNLVFVTTLIAAATLIARIFENRLIGLSAALLAMSSYYVASYRDMIHFDQPAVLGILLALHGILRVELSGRMASSIPFFMVAVSLGRSYAVLPTLAAWCMLDFYRTLVIEKKIWPAFRAWFQRPVLRLGLICVAACIVYLSFNIVLEARIRNVPIAQTSIIDSASRRLGFDKVFESERTVPLTWGLHGSVQLHRLSTAMLPYPLAGSPEFKNAIPYYTGRLGLLTHVAVVTMLAWVIATAARRLEPKRRATLILLAISGALWLAPMKNLAIPHDYTTIYHIGALLAFFASVASVVSTRHHVGRLVALISMAIFLASVNSSNREDAAKSAIENAFSDDFDRIVRLIPADSRIFIAPPYSVVVDDTPDIVPGAPYATAFYLGSRVISTSSDAEYIVSRNMSYSMENPCATMLTPRNTRVFLYVRNPACSQSMSN